MKKNFSNSLASAIGTLTEGKIADQTDPEPIQIPEKKEYVKIVLRMEKDLHADLQQIALDQAARKGKRYSLTELINDILSDYIHHNEQK